MTTKFRPIEQAAIDFVNSKGWEAGQSLGLTSVVMLMGQFTSAKLLEASQTAAKLLDGYDKGDGGFGVEEEIKRLAR